MILKNTLKENEQLFANKIYWAKIRFVVNQA